LAVTNAEFRRLAGIPFLHVHLMMLSLA